MATLIFQKIPLIMRDVGAVTKDRTNSAQNYKFRGIEDLYLAFHPVLVEHGVFCVPQVIDMQCSEVQKADGKISYRTIIKMKHSFMAEDGSSVDAITIGEGLDSSDKASNKAMSAAMKYAFIELFSVPTQDIDDSDKDSPDAGKTVSSTLPTTQSPKVGNVTRVGSAFGGNGSAF